MVIVLVIISSDSIVFFKHKTAYEMRISDWSSDVCSSDLGRDAANHQRQLNDMRGATTSQLLAVIRQSRAILEPLRDKEVQMRADAAGLPFDQVKAMSFSDQKLIKDAKGDPVGLTGDDYAKHAALTRGLKAMDEIGRASCRERGCPTV